MSNRNIQSNILESSGRYLLIPEKPIDLETLCDTKQTIHLEQPVLLTSDKDCIITTYDTIMKIGESIKNLTFEMKLKPVEINLSLEQLTILEEKMH